MPKNAFNAEYLRNILKYDPETGNWTWLIHRNKNKIGSIAGSIYSRGYRIIVINNRQYSSASLAWLYMTGNWPKNTVDHKNRNKSDDRWDNFREATHKQQGYNLDLHPQNTSGIAGVHWYERYKKWRVVINKIHVGYFNTKEEAIEVRKKIEQEIWTNTPANL